MMTVDMAKLMGEFRGHCIAAGMEKAEMDRSVALTSLTLRAIACLGDEWGVDSEPRIWFEGTDPLCHVADPGRARTDVGKLLQMRPFTSSKTRGRGRLFAPWAALDDYALWARLATRGAESWPEELLADFMFAATGVMPIALAFEQSVNLMERDAARVRKQLGSATDDAGDAGDGGGS